MLPFFQKLGLSEIEATILMTCYRMGAQPVSVIARHVGMNRTATYYHLNHLVEDGYLQCHGQATGRVYVLPSLDIIQQKIHEQQQKTQDLVSDFPAVRSQMEKTRVTEPYLPEVSLTEGNEALKVTLDEIRFRLQSEGYRRIRVIFSNALSMKKTVQIPDIWQDFWDTIAQTPVKTESFVGSGQILIDRVIRSHFQLSVAQNSSFCLLFLGRTCTMIILDRQPIILRISCEPLVELLQALLDGVSK